MKPISVWVYVCDSDKDCEPEVRVYPTKKGGKDAVKRTIEDYIETGEYGITDEAKEDARKEFAESNEERFHVTLDDGERLHIFAEKRTFEYFVHR